MKIACLQFAPEVGRVQENIQRADEILRSTAIPSDLTWLVLPELAFSGYNFQSLDEIKPFLEPTTSGISTQWAQQVAKHYNCHVTVGYAEVTIPDTNPEDTQTQYNSTVTVSPKGEILHNYRKSFLYYTDETWASEGPGSRSHKLSDASSPDSPFYAGQLGDLGKVTMGICMDINPYKFVSPWSDYEFSSLALSSQSQIVCVSMAWLCHLTPTELMQEPSQPDIATVAYWVERFQPLVDARGDKPIFVILANRCGMEKGVCYAGSSTVLRVERGVVSLYETAGKSEETCLVVDLTERPKFQLGYPGHVPQGVQSSFFVTPWVEGTSVKVAVEENAFKGAAMGLLALSGADKSIDGGRSVEDVVGEISFGKSGTTSISRASLLDTNTAVIYSPKESTVEVQFTQAHT